MEYMAAIDPALPRFGTDFIATAAFVTQFLLRVVQSSYQAPNS